ncbi:class I SAM-dependent methyltransferase [Bradyrhizobium commune]|uniref:Class I SAM-dependent methyltransferase n=1 Tax=Bradyrhizobium commune TaxID=83627 RepID=A0A7S9D311_9BRAD|nr:class I SAM-dependent methyltransferase [Bradyrhizobium commune]
MYSLPKEIDTTGTRPVDVKRLTFIHRHLHVAGARKILELGCGPGHILRTLNGYEIVVGVDNCEADIDTCRSRGLDARLAHAGMFADGAPYDVVIASEVIEHFLEPEQLLANAARNLTSGGLLILTTPNGYGWYELTRRHLNPLAYLSRWNPLRRLLGKQPYVRGSGWDHCQWFTMTRLMRLTAAAGFTPLEQQNSDFVTGGRRDSELASRLPSWAASGWYFAFRYEPTVSPSS